MANSVNAYKSEFSMEWLKFMKGNAYVVALTFNPATLCNSNDKEAKENIPEVIL